MTDNRTTELLDGLRNVGNLHEFAELFGFDWHDDSDWTWHDVAVKVADDFEQAIAATLGSGTSEALKRGEADARAEQMETERDEWKTKCEIREFAYKQADAERKRYSEQIDELRAEIATLKEHRAANMERLHELTDANAELRKYRDEWKGLAEKYRADSIAAHEETERYRAKLGDVLDALHEAERAAR